MKGIFEKLREDHDTLRRFMKTAVDNSSSSESRKSVFSNLSKELEQKTKYEESHLFQLPETALTDTERISSRRSSDHLKTFRISRKQELYSNE